MRFSTQKLTFIFDFYRGFFLSATWTRLFVVVCGWVCVGSRVACVRVAFCVLLFLVVVLPACCEVECVLLCCSLVRCPRRCCAWFLLTVSKQAHHAWNAKGKGLWFVVADCCVVAEQRRRAGMHAGWRSGGGERLEQSALPVCVLPVRVCVAAEVRPLAGVGTLVVASLFVGSGCHASC